MSTLTEFEQAHSDPHQRGPTTTSTRKTAVLVGLLFLTATAALEQPAALVEEIRTTFRGLR